MPKPILILALLHLVFAIGSFLFCFFEKYNDDIILMVFSLFSGLLSLFILIGILMKIFIVRTFICLWFVFAGGYVTFVNDVNVGIVISSIGGGFFLYFLFSSDSENYFSLQKK